MTRKTLERLSLGWIAIAAISIPLQLLARSDRAALAATRSTAAVTMSRPGADSLTALVDAAVAADLFATPQSAGTGIAPPALPAPPVGLPGVPQRRVRLSAIIGPPWRAVIESDGGQAPPRVVEAGDTLYGYKVVRIVADSVVLRKNRDVSRRLLAESWVP